MPYVTLQYLQWYNPEKFPWSANYEPGPWLDGIDFDMQSSTGMPKIRSTETDSDGNIIDRDGRYTFGGNRLNDHGNGFLWDQENAGGEKVGSSSPHIVISTGSPFIYPPDGLYGYQEVPWLFSDMTTSPGHRAIARYRRAFYDYMFIWEQADVRICVTGHAVNGSARYSWTNGVDAFSSCPPQPELTEQEQQIEGAVRFVGFTTVGDYNAASFNAYQVEVLMMGAMVGTPPVALGPVPWEYGDHPPGAAFYEIEEGSEPINCTATIFAVPNGSDYNEPVTFDVRLVDDLYRDGASYALGTDYNFDNLPPVIGTHTFTWPKEGEQAILLGTYELPDPGKLQVGTGAVTGNREYRGCAYSLMFTPQVPEDAGVAGGSPEGVHTAIFDIMTFHGGEIIATFDYTVKTPRYRYWFPPGGQAPERQVVDEPVRQTDPLAAFASPGVREQRASFEPRPM